jgi:hypothetical protein
VPLACVPHEHAQAHFGWLAAFASSDNPSSSRATQELLGWLPVHCGLLAEIGAGHYVAELTPFTDQTVGTS